MALLNFDFVLEFRFLLIVSLYFMLFFNFFLCLRFFLLLLCLELYYAAVFFHNFDEIFGLKHSFNTLSKDDIIWTYEKLYSIFHSPLKINLNHHVATASHTWNNSFFFWHSWSKMDMISCHFIQTSTLYTTPKLREGTMYDTRIFICIGDFGQ